MVRTSCGTGKRFVMCPRYCEIFGPGACAGVFDEKECVMSTAKKSVMENVRLELPIPPLVNHYWRHIIINGTPRTLISARGRDFRKNVVQIVGDEKKALKIDSRVKVNVVVCPPDRRKRRRFPRSRRSRQHVRRIIRHPVPGHGEARIP